MENKKNKLIKRIKLSEQIDEIKSLNPDSFFMNQKIYSAGTSIESFVSEFFSDCSHKIKLAIEAVLAAAVYSHKHNKWCMYSRNNTHKQKMSRYKEERFDNRLIYRVVDKLEELGFVETMLGLQSVKTKYLSRFKATDNLIELLRDYKLEKKKRNESLILKSDSPVDYKDTNKSNLLRKEINNINKELAEHSWVIVLSEQDIERVPTYCIQYIYTDKEFRCSTCSHSACNCLKSLNTVPWQLFPPEYKRVFKSNKNKYNKHEEWNLHGRWYCDLQNIPKELRKNIKIDNEETVELDYSSLHLAIAYSLEGLNIPEGDLYEIENYPRNIVKKAIISILNCDSQSQAISVLIHNETFKDFWKDNETLSAKDLYEKLASKHSQISNYFSSSFGLRAMHYDSDIARNILKAFTRLSKPILGIHDSFIVKAADEVLLKSVMVEQFQNVLNTTNKAKVKKCN